MMRGLKTCTLFTVAPGFPSWPALVSLLLLLCVHSSAQAPSNEEPHSWFPNVRLQDHHTNTHRFYSDLLQGNIVVINSFFSECKGSCPLINASMHRIQEHFAGLEGKKLVLISISVDPATDTPAVLNAYAERFAAKPGWYFLTGSRENIGTVLYKLGLASATREQHLDIILIGNEETGLWKKANGLASAEQLIALVQSVIDDEL